MSDEQDSRYDRLAVRLSVIISRLMAGEALYLKPLADEFGVSERTLQRDFHQRLVHLDIRHDDGCYRLSESQLRDHSPSAFSFIRNTGLARIMPGQDKALMDLLINESGTAPCLIWHTPLDFPATHSGNFQRLAEAIHRHCTISLLVNGIRHDALEPYRLIYQVHCWYLVTSHLRRIRVFRLDEIISVTLLERHFRRRSDVSDLIAEEGFIAALPHFRFISDVIHTFNQ
ncbi:helix-turn-helix transcriptional regulator [Klebsiella aerogenes]|uniref:helix-turn-helix transcriptional regulator n=1 Tax=Klebsiella aerogenes TaxID=548 RepID=UPI00351CBFFF